MDTLLTTSTDKYVGWMTQRGLKAEKRNHRTHWLQTAVRFDL